jgi:hypothetical protein
MRKDKISQFCADFLGDECSSADNPGTSEIVQLSISLATKALKPSINWVLLRVRSCARSTDLTNGLIVGERRITNLASGFISRDVQFRR